jgi:hypothetical protein
MSSRCAPALHYKVSGIGRKRPPRIAASRKRNSAGRNNAAARTKNAPTNGGMAAWKATLRCCDEVPRKNRRGARRNEW